MVRLQTVQPEILLGLKETHNSSIAIHLYRIDIIHVGVSEKASLADINSKAIVV